MLNPRQYENRESTEGLVVYQLHPGNVISDAVIRRVADNPVVTITRNMPSLSAHVAAQLSNTQHPIMGLAACIDAERSTAMLAKARSIAPDMFFKGKPALPHLRGLGADQEGVEVDTSGVWPSADPSATPSLTDCVKVHNMWTRKGPMHVERCRMASFMHRFNQHPGTPFDPETGGIRWDRDDFQHRGGAANKFMRERMPDFTVAALLPEHTDGGIDIDGDVEGVSAAVQAPFIRPWINGAATRWFVTFGDVTEPSGISGNYYSGPRGMVFGPSADPLGANIGWTRSRIDGYKSAEILSKTGRWFSMNKEEDTTAIHIDGQPALILPTPKAQYEWEAINFLLFFLEWDKMFNIPEDHWAGIESREERFRSFEFNEFVKVYRVAAMCRAIALQPQIMINEFRYRTITGPLFSMYTSKYEHSHHFEKYLEMNEQIRQLPVNRFYSEILAPYIPVSSKTPWGDNLSIALPPEVMNLLLLDRDSTAHDAAAWDTFPAMPVLHKPLKRALSPEDNAFWKDSLALTLQLHKEIFGSLDGTMISNDLSACFETGARALGWVPLASNTTPMPTIDLLNPPVIEIMEHTMSQRVGSHYEHKFSLVLDAGAYRVDADHAIDLLFDGVRTDGGNAIREIVIETARDMDAEVRFFGKFDPLDWFTRIDNDTFPSFHAKDVCPLTVSHIAAKAGLTIADLVAKVRKSPSMWRHIFVMDADFLAGTSDSLVPAVNPVTGQPFKLIHQVPGYEFVLNNVRYIAPAWIPESFCLIKNEMMFPRAVPYRRGYTDLAWPSPSYTYEQLASTLKK